MPDAAPSPPRFFLPITGMSCAACAPRIRRALLAVPGVVAAEVNPATALADIRGTAATADLIAALHRAGYAVPEEVLDLAIGGLSCAACVTRLERALAAVPGVIAVQVSLASERAHLRLTAGTDREAILAAIERAGYRVCGIEESGTTDAAARREIITLIVAILLAGPFLIGMLGMAVGQGWLPAGWLQAVLASALLFGPGARFWRAAWAALKAGYGSMDQLVVLGTTAAWALSLYSLLRDGAAAAHHLYFEASALVVLFVLLGKWLEGRTKRATGAAIRTLFTLAPRTARRLDGESEREVPAAALTIGDRVVVRPGERIPADGLVLEGQAGVDESQLTGESRAVEKEPGSAVIAGSLVLDGRLVLRVTATGGETLLARIATLVAAAQASRAGVQRLVDRLSALFVPLVVALAVLAGGGWILVGARFEEAVITAVSVLVIACPCALGLATPTAIMAGVGAAARAGILIRDAEAIERAGQITVVAFDKTGTLTAGQPRLAALHPAPGVRAAEALALAAALQAGSEHPLAQATRAAHPGPIAAAEQFRALPGRGVEGIVGGRPLVLGSPRLLQDRGGDAGPLTALAAAEAAKGRSLAWLIEGQRVLALLAFEDTPKTEAAQAIAALKRMGLQVAMLSGDIPEAAQATGQALGVDTIAAGLLPEAKTEQITTWQRAGARVAMVGDGINDAPALAAADLGIAIGAATEVAKAAAGIILLRDSLALVPAALTLARRTYARIRLNLFWAFAYNVAALPLAAFGRLTPAVAAAAMAASSLSVVISALLLARWRPPQEG